MIEIFVGNNDDVIGVCIFFGVDFIVFFVVLIMGIFMNGKIWVGCFFMLVGRVGELVLEGFIENL